MRVMLLEKVREPLKLREVEVPRPGRGELLVEVAACGVCRTDLHIIDGELLHPRLPLILGHQIVGRVAAVGEGVDSKRIGERVGVPWLGGSCNQCAFCKSGRENLCKDAVYTGYQKGGGFAEFCTADADHCFSLPAGYDDLEAAPLLCAGMIGYRALTFIREARRIGLYGFGSSAHLILQLAKAQGREVVVFTREGDKAAQQLAKQLGAIEVYGSETLPSKPLDAAIIFAPVGALVPLALKAVGKAGVVVCAGIHMSDIPSFPYELLWEERELRSVANLTLQDGREFLKLAEKFPLRVSVHAYPLEKANEALRDLKEGKITGSAVLVIKPNPN
ncbi:MAG: zinc-dependent alcohol dehydrogenase family protein [Chlamydiales bacterium]|nr:zinc-dependent alcohol dehydrogenase family protein [Chlamydiales bacterium]